MIMRFRGVHGWLHCRSWWWLVIPLGGMRGVLNLEGFNTRGDIVWCIGFLIYFYVGAIFWARGGWGLDPCIPLQPAVGCLGRFGWSCWSTSCSCYVSSFVHKFLRPMKCYQPLNDI